MQTGFDARRLPSGLIDFDFYRVCAAQERRLQQRLVARTVFAGLGHVARLCVTAVTAGIGTALAGRERLAGAAPADMRA